MRQKATITAKQRRLIEALLAGQSVTAATRQLGINRATFYRWAKQDAFKAALADAEAELLANAMRRLLSMQSGALDALSDLVSDRRLPGARLAAAKTVLDAVLRFRNAVELEARLAELERKVEAAQAEMPPSD
ncbi:helix-turn-helix domain-containing protein [Thermanaerothrix sp. 4228-RoL]|uniref:Helix-turn-helix domain-containing protein n=1 Tax=Thermanaerothrix solaris TaxID=3058434 RepID=A0ABU3NIU3_9CHLR|nr:helix-turn-helix domain-containing protein [Thermanaerothrix sp. 4228-RoL]MDT8896776.1 helix-turn-helix domain-containing protein [Thermanaerothrix sp. 4228-RoL]